MMEGIDEPLVNPWYSCLMFFTISLITPFVAPGLPMDINDVMDGSVNGLPWWVVKMFVVALIPTIILLISVLRMPNQYCSRPTNGNYLVVSSAKVTDEAPDIDVMEMTPAELGYRTRYDGRNDLVYQRRLQILEKLGISPLEIDSVINATAESNDSQSETCRIIEEGAVMEA